MTDTSLLPQAPQQTPPDGASPSDANLVGYSVDELYDFFDFFDKTVEDVYAYVLHCTRVPERASDATLNVYFSLLQRRKFFWWKNTAQLATILALADKEIASMRTWEEEAAGSSYLQEILHCVAHLGDQKTALERLHLFLQVMRKLPLREQRMAVLQFFLHWSAKKTASIIGRSPEIVEREYAAITDAISAELGHAEVFQGTDPRQFLSSVHCSPLAEGKQTALRLALLERSRAAQMSSMRFAMPVAAFLIVAGSLIGSGVALTTPLSAGGTLKQIAAVEVLLLDRERSDLDALLQVEHDLRGLAFHYAERDLAPVTMDLAPYAVAKQLDQERQVTGILRKFGLRSVQLSALLQWPTVSAAGAD